MTARCLEQVGMDADESLDAKSTPWCLLHADVSDLGYEQKAHHDFSPNPHLFFSSCPPSRSHDVKKHRRPFSVCGRTTRRWTCSEWTTCWRTAGAAGTVRATCTSTTARPSSSPRFESGVWSPAVRSALSVLSRLANLLSPLPQVYYADFNPYQPLSSPKVSHCPPPPLLDQTLNWKTYLYLQYCVITSLLCSVFRVERAVQSEPGLAWQTGKMRTKNLRLGLELRTVVLRGGMHKFIGECFLSARRRWFSLLLDCVILEKFSK